MLVSYPLGIHSEVEFLGHMIVLFFFFFFEEPLFSIVAQFVFPPMVHNDSHFSISSPTLISCLFDDGHSNRCEGISPYEISNAFILLCKLFHLKCIND